MAKIRVGALGRFLLIVVAVVLALPALAEGAYGQSPAAAPGHERRHPRRFRGHHDHGLGHLGAPGIRR